MMEVVRVMSQSDGWSESTRVEDSGSETMSMDDDDAMRSMAMMGWDWIDIKSRECMHTVLFLITFFTVYAYQYIHHECTHNTSTLVLDTFTTLASS